MRRRAIHAQAIAIKCFSVSQLVGNPDQLSEKLSDDRFVSIRKWVLGELMAFSEGRRVRKVHSLESAAGGPFRAAATQARTAG